MITPIHVRAQPGDVAPAVILVGDPGRATRAAKFLDGARCYNEFRGLLGYTGNYVVEALVAAARASGHAFHVGPIATEDALYCVREGWTEKWRARGILAQEMEASVIFTLGALRGLEAGCILVASNAAGQHERLADDALAPHIDAMLHIALEACVTRSGQLG